MSFKDDFAEKFKRVMDGYQKALDVSLEKALDRCAEEYIGQLERTAPRTGAAAGGGKPYHQCFAVKSTVKKNRYVGNTKTVKGAGGVQIPLINLLEFGRGPEREGASPHMNDALIATMYVMDHIIEEELKGVK